MDKVAELLEFIIGLNPIISYPPDREDDVVVWMEQFLWEAVVQDATEILEALKETSDE